MTPDQRLKLAMDQLAEMMKIAQKALQLEIEAMKEKYEQEAEKSA